jgi:hypothetical protein
MSSQGDYPHATSSSGHPYCEGFIDWAAMEQGATACALRELTMHLSENTTTEILEIRMQWSLRW